MRPLTMLVCARPLHPHPLICDTIPYHVLQTISGGRAYFHMISGGRAFFHPHFRRAPVTSPPTLPPTPLAHTRTNTHSRTHSCTNPRTHPLPPKFTSEREH
eukprot:6194763-Pleurochrysis_carterae.AAC.1